MQGKTERPSVRRELENIKREKARGIPEAEPGKEPWTKENAEESEINEGESEVGDGHRKAKF